MNSAFCPEKREGAYLLIVAYALRKTGFLLNKPSLLGGSAGWIIYGSCFTMGLTG